MAAFTCAFTKRGCSHSSMFSGEYQRTNRTKGTKILRCFPHCCPLHVDRSYCGGSIYVQLDSRAPSLPRSHDHQFVCFAHFHPTTDPGFPIGELVPVERFHQNQQTILNPSGEWVSARLATTLGQTSWLFEVNPSGRWYYQWESGATKAQRATAHRFTVYVLELDLRSRRRYQVIARTTSPSFRLISFRRAPSDVRSGRLAQGSTSDGDDDSEPRWSYRDSVDSISSSIMVREPSPAIPKPPTPVDAFRMDRYDAVETDNVSSLPPRDVMQIAADLGITYDRLQHVPCSLLARIAPDLVEFGLVSMRRPASNREISWLLRPFMPTTDVEPPTRLVERDLNVVLHATWLLFDHDVAQQLHSAVRRASDHLLDRSGLLQVFFRTLEDLDHVMHRQNRSAFRDVERRTPPTSSSASSSSLVTCRGLESFVAQAREAFMAKNSDGRLPSTPSSTSLRKRPRQQYDAVHLLHQLRGDWSVDTGSITSRRSPTAGDTQHTPSVFAMLWAWRQLLQFELQVEDHPTQSVLVVRSWWNPTTMTRTNAHSHAHGARLILDGKPRSLRTFPSGESTSAVLIGSQRIGHYMASLRPDTNELVVNCYSWPVATDGGGDSVARYSYCLRWCVRVVGADVLDARLAVECGHIPVGVDVVALDEIPLARKLQAVDRWTTVHSLQYQCRNIVSV